MAPEFAPERAVNPVPRRLAATGKAERLLGFRTSVSLEQGLADLVKWLLAERELSSVGQGQAAAS